MKIIRLGRSPEDGTVLKELAQVLKGGKAVLLSEGYENTDELLNEAATYFCEANNERALAIFEHVKKLHLSALNRLETAVQQEYKELLEQLFVEAEWALHDKPIRQKEYYFDQIVSLAPLLGSVLWSAYLKANNVNNKWLDIRDGFRTNNQFGTAVPDEAYIKQNLTLADTITVTQNGIGATDENESTRLNTNHSTTDTINRTIM